MKFITVFSALLLGFLSAAALEVSCTPGELRGVVSNPASVSELKISGSVDASDLFFIDSEMPGLRSLDLSNAAIVAYHGTLLRGAVNYEADMIPARAFAGSPMTSVTFPTRTTILGDGAFAGSALSHVYLTPAVRADGLGVFAGCPSLVEVVTGGAVCGDYAFSACPALVSADLHGNTRLPEGMFKDCAALSTVSGAEALTSVGPKSFDGCKALASIAFGSALGYIGDRAFASSGIAVADMSGCTALRSMGSWVFTDCRALTSAFLPAALESIGKGTFADCTSLRDVKFPAIDIADYTFKDAPLAASPDIMPEGVSTVGDYALKGATGVALVNLPSSLEYLGDGAMESMTGLTDIDATALASVPETGERVWEGVNQKNVNLKVRDDLGTSFASTPQWQEFHINAISTLTSAVEAEKTLLARFEDMNLIVRSTGGQIAGIALYDVTGALLMSVRSASEEVMADTSHIGGNLFIVRVTMADGASAVFKMLR